MAIDDPNELARIDAEIARNERELNPLPWDEIEPLESEDADFEDEEAFDGTGQPTDPTGEKLDPEIWGEELAAWHNAPLCSHMDILRRDGLELPPPEALDDESLHEMLWRLIHHLAYRNTFISQTDHLSDRELYEHLWYESLQEYTKDLGAALPPGKLSGPDAWVHSIDILGSGSEEDLELRLRYYADEEERSWWAKQHADLDLPPREEPPHDRDRFLPQPPEAFLDDESEDAASADDDEGEPAM